MSTQEIWAEVEDTQAAELYTHMRMGWYPHDEEAQWTKSTIPQDVRDELFVDSPSQNAVPYFGGDCITRNFVGKAS